MKSSSSTSPPSPTIAKIPTKYAALGTIQKSDSTGTPNSASQTLRSLASLPRLSVVGPPAPLLSRTRPDSVGALFRLPYFPAFLTLRYAIHFNRAPPPRSARSTPPNDPSGKMERFHQPPSHRHCRPHLLSSTTTPRLEPDPDFAGDRRRTPPCPRLISSPFLFGLFTRPICPILSSAPWAQYTTGNLASPSTSISL